MIMSKKRLSATAKKRTTAKRKRPKPVRPPKGLGIYVEC
jgi:hypothetical protein